MKTTKPSKPVAPSAAGLLFARSSSARPAARLPAVRARILPDGYKLDVEAIKLRHLINGAAKGELNVADPLFERYEIYLEKLKEWEELNRRHEERAGAQADVPTEEARKTQEISPLQGQEEDTMTLHTLEAARLYLGGEPAPGEVRYSVPGARRCATSLRQLFHLSSNDNPYADWALVMVDQRLAELKERMDQIEHQHLGLLNKAKQKGLNYSVLVARNPSTVSLGYRSPYGYSMSNVIVQFDYTVRLIKSTQRRDLIAKSIATQQILELKRSFRSLFEASIRLASSLFQPQLRDLTRADWLPVADDAAKARVAAVTQLHDKVPQEVFTGEHKPRHSLRNERLSARDRDLLAQLAASINEPDPVQPGGGISDAAAQGLVD